MGFSAARGAKLYAVTDESRIVPVLPHPAACPGGGRGLHVVAALSRSWGVRLVHRRGKTVWARLPAPRPGAKLPYPRSALGS